jgi:serine protein kinase
MLREGLERYTRLPEGAVYAIAGCPMHEEPLHLIPKELRPEILQEYGLYIEGALCPSCNYRLQHEWDNDIYRVPVERIVFSAENRVGLGTFAPSDPKSQDVSELVGSIDLSTIAEIGVESDPRAYRFDGEFNVANRGICEMVEMLKADEKLLYALLTLTQEQNIKTGRFSLIYADEVVLSHTNENEFNAFAGNPKAEALHDRIILVKVPYNLRVTEEIKIYEKLLKQSNLSGVHIAPHTLHVASVFAVLSRLEPSKKANMTLMKKLKLYDGEDVEGWKARDVKELREEAQREGMDGISPRYIIDRLSNALIRNGVTCINPINALRALRDGFEQHTSFSREDREHFLNLIAETRREYDEMAKKEVQRAFVYAFEESAKTLLNNYLDNVEAYCRKDKIRDPLTDEEVEPDEKLMRSIEEQIGVTENGKGSFRESILMSMASLSRRGRSFEYTSDERLKEAIEKKLFADLKDVIKITTSTTTPDAEQLRRINDVVDRMVRDHGYCVVCAQETLKYVGQLLNR